MARMATSAAHDRWEALTRLLNRADQRGVASLSVAEVKALCRLYRHVAIDLSRARADADDPALVSYLNHLVARAHGRVYSSRRVELGVVWDFLTRGFARVVRRRAGAILLSAGLFLLATLASFLAVTHDPELAYALFDENIIEYENIRLERQQGEYKGNFTFDVSASPLVAVLIIGNNVRVAFFAFALGALGCLPGVLLLVFNGRMLGTLGGVVWNHGYLFDFSALILTHGILELTAICISAAAGLLLGWALVAPGEQTRRQALATASRDAMALVVGAALMLVVAGVIEAHVTPHFGKPVRLAVAGASLVLMLLYFLFAGRSAQSSPRPAISR
jgi:uncharacterized membrane protein SpoIIM required for sporulation